MGDGTRLPRLVTCVTSCELCPPWEKNPTIPTEPEFWAGILDPQTKLHRFPNQDLLILQVLGRPQLWNIPSNQHRPCQIIRWGLEDWFPLRKICYFQGRTLNLPKGVPEIAF